MSDSDKPVSEGVVEAADEIEKLLQLDDLTPFGREQLEQSIQQHAVAPVEAERTHLFAKYEHCCKARADYQRERNEARAAAGELWAALYNVLHPDRTGAAIAGNAVDKLLDKHAAFASQSEEQKP